MDKNKLRNVSEQAGHKKSPILNVVRSKCLDCCVGSLGEVRKCHIVNCDLWPYRFGTNPFCTVKLTESEREKRIMRMTNNSG